MLVKEIESGDEVVIGFDFAFSFPQWYLLHRKLCCVHELWDLAERERRRVAIRPKVAFLGPTRSISETSREPQGPFPISTN